MPHPMVSLAQLALGATLAMNSPWWENYDQRDSYRCGDRHEIVLERNAAQASLILGGARSTLFREERDGPDLRYRNGSIKLTLRGDEITVEQFPRTITCVRTDEV
jgi:hypothetical protein